MAKYDALLGDLQSKITASQSILIALPKDLSEDKLASGLSLFLALQDLNKQVAIVSEGIPLVAHSNLYGIGDVKSSLPQGGGNFVITLEGVVAPDGTVPSLEKLDWFPQGQNLNLVFHVLSGQKFEPVKVTPQFQGQGVGGFNLIFVVGSANLADLGGIYSTNLAIFSQAPIINIDNSQNNAQFGQLNIVDPASPSISEMMVQIFQGIGLNMDQDIASNILRGIYSGTNNLTSNVSPDTFEAVAALTRIGGKIPSISAPVQQAPTPQPEVQSLGLDIRNFVPQYPQVPVHPQPTQQVENYTVPPVVGTNQSTEETPSGEYATSSSPESANPSPDWLTPKVYKGTSLG